MAFQNIVGIRLAQTTLTTAYGTIYTTPALTRTYIKDISVCNTTSGALTFWISLVPSGGTAGASNALFYNTTIPAYTAIQWTGSQILTPGDLISAKASASGIPIMVTGGEAT